MNLPGAIHTVSRIPRRAGLSRFSDLAPVEAVQRYERDALGDLLHIDNKKQGCFSDVGHRLTGNFAKRTRGFGYDYLFVAVDDHARVAFTAMRLDERKDSAESFVLEAVAYFAKLGVTVRRVLTDNGPAFHSFAFVDACADLGIKQRLPRAYRPQTNGKAERLLQSALREGAYGRAFATSEARRAALPAWKHLYNWHRPHSTASAVFRPCLESRAHKTTS